MTVLKQHELAAAPMQLKQKHADYRNQLLRFRRSIWKTLWLRSSLRATAVGLWICGTVILVARLMWGLSPGLASTVLLSLLSIVLSCAWLAWRQLPTMAMLRSVIDVTSGAGGLLVASGEIELDWARAQQLESLQIRPPKVNWRSMGVFGLIAPACLFVLASLMVPSAWLDGAERRQQKLDVAQNIDQLQDKLETLQEFGILPEDESESIRDNLRRIEDQAESKDPTQTLEAIDHMEQRFEMLADDKAVEATRASRETSELSAAADALDQASDKMSSESLQEALKELAEMAQEAAQEFDSFDLEASDTLASLCEDGLSAAELSDLADALAQCNGASGDMLAQLANAGLIDPSMLGQAMECMSPQEIAQLAEMLTECEGAISNEGLQELLSQCQACMGQDGDALAAMLASMPGRGGVTRGPGAAGLNYSGETDEHGATFKNEAMPRGGLNPDGISMTRKVTRGQAGNDEERAASTGGGLTGEAGGGGAHARTILPQHRSTVGKYFGKE